VTEKTMLTEVTPTVARTFTGPADIKSKRRSSPDLLKADVTRRFATQLYDALTATNDA